jgi:Carboxypeptidase regulatory-like domain
MHRNSFLKAKWFLLLNAALFSVLAGGQLFAQSGSSSVRGIVSDPQGRSVTGATVTLFNTERNFSRTQTTGDEGSYIFSSIPPGTYQLTVEVTGFKKASVTDVQALVDTLANVDVALEVGNVSETVTVSGVGEAPLNTTDATIGNTFESRRISELPLNARNVVGLLSLQPGVTRSGAVNGGRSDQANITLDGVDVNEQQRGIDVVNDEAFASVLRVTPDSVQEFRVITSNPNAEQGRSSGAQVSLVTKSGDNDWHALLYEYHRNTITTANDFFNNKAGVPRPQLLRNIFGGSLGGPIKRDKAFFFFTYEGFREATASSVVRTVPLPQSIGQGIIRYRTASGASDASCPAGTPSGFRCLTPAQITAAYAAANGGLTPGTSAAAIALLRNATTRYPANDTTTGDLINTGGFRFNANTPTKTDTYIGRMDFNITNRQNLFIRGNLQEDNVGQAPQFPDMPAPKIWYHPKGIAIGHTWTGSSNFVNRFTYGLTRLAFSQLGDSDVNRVSFRFVFDPVPTRTLTRVTPVHNFVDDISWIRGNHNFQFGPNIRLIKNQRQSFANSYDFAQTNPSGYNASAAVLTSAGADATGGPIFPDVASGSLSPLRNALTAFIGRFSGYSANFLYDSDGKLLPSGSSAGRTFATQEYDAYFQDSWRYKPNLTFTYGLRYSTSTPVYEVNGFQIVPTVPLGEYFDQRVASADRGVPFNTPITLDKGGKFYGKPGFYEQDWNNFAPSIAVAYSPDFGDNFFGKLFGRQGKGVIRGGFRVTYDRIGSQLAVNFDLSNQLGFASTLSIPVNTYNVSSALAPQYTGGIPNVRSLPGIAGFFSNQLTFPLLQPSDQAQRIETSLDSALTTPYNYGINATYEREVGKGMSIQFSYVSRLARNLLAQRDIMQLNNLRDPLSGQTWYEAINQLIDHRYAGTPILSVSPIPFFQNVLPGLAGNQTINGVSTPLTATQRAYRSIALPRVGLSATVPCLAAPAAACGSNVTDYTFRQLQWDDQPISAFANTFFHPQYGALNTWSTVGKSNYNSFQMSIRQRFHSDLLFDFNYTYGHSLDNGSGLQSVGNFSTQSFIFNALDPDSNYGDSDFDARHIINANWLVGLPAGRGKKFLNTTNSVVNGILGNWQMTGIFRWNSGLPTGTNNRPFGFQRWPTNWNLSSGFVRTRPLVTSPGDASGEPNIFADPLAALLSFRDARPGEAGDRNVFRLPGYFALDAGLYKTFKLPWEGHSVTFRWEVYNVTNTQRLTTPGGFSVSAVDPYLQGTLGLPAITAAPADFGKFTATQRPLGETKAGRVMQFALRYQF